MIAIALAAALAMAPVAMAEPPVHETDGCVTFAAGTVLEFPDGFPGVLLTRDSLANPFAAGEGSKTRLCMVHPYGPSFAVRVVDDGELVTLLFTGDPEADLVEFLTALGAPAEDFTSLGLTPPAEVEVPTDGPTATPEPQVPTAEPAPELPTAPFDPLPLLAGGAILGGLVTGAAVVWTALRRRPVGETTGEDADA
jgi:hypothetical protein